ncbi:MAG: alpha/beta fold hydrolase [Microthrixaceae bacterium]
MPHVDRPGATLYYERAGSGPPLLYCNGSGTTIDAVRPLLEMLAARYELIAYDHRGMGRSTFDGSPYTMADLAADAAAVLDDAGWDHCNVAGLSFGGMVAQELAVTWPERVERLALLVTSPGGAFPSYPLDTLADLPLKERADRSLQLSDRRWTPEWVAAHPDDPALAMILAAGNPTAETEEQRAGRLAQLEARRHHDVFDRLVLVSAPTFVGSGRYDDIAPVRNGEAIVERIPDATLHVYEGGHAFILQDPSAWRDLTAFLDG